MLVIRREDVATSNTVTVSWISVPIASSPASVAVGHQATVTATASLDMGPTPYWIEVLDLTTNTLLSQCPAGTDCTVLVNQSAAGPHAYTAFVAGLATAQHWAGSSTVFVDWVSNTPPVPQVVVPNLVGDTPAQATAALQPVSLFLNDQGTTVD